MLVYFYKEKTDVHVHYVTLSQQTPAIKQHSACNTLMPVNSQINKINIHNSTLLLPLSVCMLHVCLHHTAVIVHCLLGLCICYNNRNFNFIHPFCILPFEQLLFTLHIVKVTLTHAVHVVASVMSIMAIIYVLLIGSTANHFLVALSQYQS